MRIDLSALHSTGGKGSIIDPECPKYPVQGTHGFCVRNRDYGLGYILYIWVHTWTLREMVLLHCYHGQW